MKKTNQFSLFLSLVLLSSSVIGAPYISGQVGMVGFGDHDNPYSNITGKDSDIKATGRVAGGYLFDVNNCLKVGLEAGLNGFGKEKFTTTILTDQGNTTLNQTWRRTSVDTLAVLDYQVTPEVNLFAKAGPAFVREKLSQQMVFSTANVSLQGAGSLSNCRVTPKAVIGAGYNVTESVNLNLALSHEFKRDANKFVNNSLYANAMPSSTTLMAGVNFNFA